jgi:hypothetical protein
MKSAQEVLEELGTRNFDALIGIAESVWLEAKETPYPLDTPKQKLELAKDVSALANSGGGIIVIGFDTSRNLLTSGEYISRVCPFPLTLLNVDRYKQILGDLVHPPPTDITIQAFDNTCGDGNGVAAIIVDAAAGSGRPYLVGKMLVETDQSIGA